MLLENGLPLPPSLRAKVSLGLQVINASHLQVYTGCLTPNELTTSKNADKKKAAITWNDRCQQSFDDLKHLCTMAPTLSYADFKKPFKLHTNACRSGLGAVSSTRLVMTEPMPSLPTPVGV